MLHRIQGINTNYLIIFTEFAHLSARLGHMILLNQTLTGQLMAKVSPQKALKFRVASFVGAAESIERYLAETLKDFKK